MLALTAADQLNEFLSQDCPHLKQWSDDPGHYWGEYSARLQVKDAATMKQFRDPANNLSPGHDWGVAPGQVVVGRFGTKVVKRSTMKRGLVYRSA